MKKIIFPKNFMWGGAVSAEQTEGRGVSPKGVTIYETHFKNRPKDFFNEIGPLKTIDATKYYKEDIKLMKSLGLNSHRTSISWSRIFPNGMEKPCQEGVKFYHDFIEEFKKHDIELILTLFHFDLPQYELDKGGFESREVCEDFNKYAEFVFKEYGSKVKYWTTMNEFWVPVHAGYIHGIQPPFLKDEQSAVNAAYGIVMAHAKAVNTFNKIVKPNYPEHLIGGIFNSTITYPRDEKNPDDVLAAKYMNAFQFTGLTDAAINGKWSQFAIDWVKEMNIVPKNYKKEDIDELSKIRLDFIGLNFYAPARAKAPDKSNAKNKFEEYFSSYALPNRRENKFRGWEIYPEAVYDTLEFMYNRYGGNKHKYMLTEYGMGVENEDIFRNKEGYIEDNYRVSFIKEHLLHLNRFMNDFDVEVMGAHVWATFDCWSWNNAFKNRYGLIEVNLQTMQRIPKASGLFFKNLIEVNSFDDDFKPVEEHIAFDELEYSKSIVI